MRTYLAGPIFGKSDAECNDWRAAFKTLPGEWIDPMDRDYRGREDDCYKEIVEGDKTDIACCDRLIAMADRPSWGTAMEIYHAFRRGIPIWVICQGPVSPWLRYHADCIFPSVDAAIDRIVADAVVTFVLHKPRGHVAITVCDRCLRASCWQGIFMCDEAREAGTREMAPADLLVLKLEHPSYWKAEIDAALDAIQGGDDARAALDAPQAKEGTK